MKPIVNVLSKFRGSIQGVLVGDCFGATYEGELLTKSDKTVLRKLLDKLEAKYVRGPARQYTDDTAMTKALMVSLIQEKGFVQLTTAKEFAREYFQSPNRGYGGAVETVFRRLKGSNFKDILEPARNQFDGMGSYGNGAAMRIAPVALFCAHKSIDELVTMVRGQSVITHTHALAIAGSILQAMAVRQAVQLNPNEPLDIEKYLDNLNSEIVKVDDEHGSYQTQIGAIRKLINSEHIPSEEKIVDALGHSVSALFSVPTAIYCFLRSTQEDRRPEGVTSENPFRRCLEYAISLGGDTDTIASMACSISGAYHGDTIVPENLLKVCEEFEALTEQAEQLYKASQWDER